MKNNHDSHEGFYTQKAKEYLQSMENWERSPSDCIAIEVFASFLDRTIIESMKKDSKE